MSQALTQLAQQARQMKVFAAVTVADGVLRCEARESDGAAAYTLGMDQETGKLYISLETPDRWLSESIEADLMHQADNIEELLEEELVEQGHTLGRLTVQHFRDDRKIFVFRSLLPWKPSQLQEPAVAAQLLKILLAYEACFSQLGDLKPDAW